LSAIHTESASATEEVGARLAARLEPGDVVLVSGELGAGKTTLIRGAALELGVTEQVVSPTFTIGHRYLARGDLWVSHLDLYRIGDLAREEPWLLDDYLTPDAITFVEWPEVAADALEDDDVRVAGEVRISHAGGDARGIEVSGDLDLGRP
jgi:tRNA threonylcarbamoyladenosine biosynthesis protein TsaE